MIYDLGDKIYGAGYHSRIAVRGKLLPVWLYRDCHVVPIPSRTPRNDNEGGVWIPNQVGNDRGEELSEDG